MHHIIVGNREADRQCINGSRNALDQQCSLANFLFSIILFLLLDTCPQHLAANVAKQS